LKIKKALEAKIAKDKNELAALEKEAAAAKCSFWEAVFTLGIACANARKLRSKLES
jgi:hypothetical protein